MPLPNLISDVLDAAIGEGHRPDPVTEITGGPAGNARITAWTGLVLLVPIVVELITLIDVRGMIDWHIVVGTLLLPVALLKTATTTWRFGRYYTGNLSYRRAGPPPTLLRILGPLVVITTLALLASGIALILLGTDASRNTLFSFVGQDVDTLTLHQALFIPFAAVTGLHTLGQLVPAVTLVTGRLQRAGSSHAAVPGGSWRIVALLMTLVIAAITAALVLGASTSWKSDGGDRGQRPPGLPVGIGIWLPTSGP